MVDCGRRTCARAGCAREVKKPTNKYCSRACCALDPERKERLREAGRRHVLPMSRQLSLEFRGWDEGVFVAGCADLEEAPQGLSRLAVV